jgi:YVTN family beta-propeller protein
MHVRRLAPYSTALLLLLLAGPGEATGGAPERRDKLFPVPARVLHVCHKAQDEQTFRVLCPARLPRASVGYPGQPPNPLTTRLVDDRRTFYGIEFAYGAPYETRQWRNHPRRFLHLAILRARTSIATPPEGSTPLGDKRLAGRRGSLFHAPPYFKGGGYNGNHLMFTWHERKTAYTISLHSWRRAEALQLLEEVIASLRPVSTRPAPQPRVLAPDTSRVRIGSQPSALAVGADTLWVARFLPAGKVVSVSLQRAETVGRPVRVGRYPYRGMAADDQNVWVVTQSDSVTRIDARSARVTARDIPVGETPFAVAIGARYVWVANYDDGSLTRIDPRTNRVVGRPIHVGGGPNGVAFLRGSIWVTDFDGGRVVRVDESTGKIVAEISVGAGLSGIATSSDAVWVTDFDKDELIRIDPSANEIVAEVPVGPAPSGVAAQEDAVWIVDYWDATVRRIDSETNKVVERSWVGGRPWQVVASQDDVWVLDQSGPVVRIPSPRPSRRVEAARSRLGWPLTVAAVGFAIVATGVLIGWRKRRHALAA